MFRNARIKLTAWYLLIIMTVSVFFSVVIYQVLSQEVERFAMMQRTRIERRLQDQVIITQLPPPNLHQQIAILDPDLVGETKQRIFFTLIFINGSIALLAGALGYVLSGKTLKPIALMLEEQHRFISDASHELRTPLTALKSNLEVTLRNTRLTSAEAKKTLRESLEDTGNLERLSDKLLVLSQLESRRHETHVASLSIPDVINRAVHAVAPLAQRKQVRIVKNLKNITMEGDAHDIVDLCITLLDNAIKYSHEKGIVNIETTHTKKELCITVVDHGIGIPKKDLPHIFDRFFRADAARSTSKRNGYGLGLAIAKRIVESHHGTLAAESSVDNGSTFTVILPKKQRT